MRRTSPDSYNWAAGSYLDLFTVAAFTQVLFSISLYWVFFHDASLYTDPNSVASLTSTNYPLLALGTLATVGWLMALLLGIGFDRLPLDYKTAPFDKSTISTVAALNIIGQIFIFAGIISGNFDLLKQLGMMGGAILGLQLVLIGPLGWRVAKARVPQPEEKVGLWVVGTLLAMPIMGVMTILVWLMADYDWFYSLYWVVFMDGFWLMAAFALILAHFQQRLGWHLMDAKVTTRAFQVFVILSLIHIILEYLYQVEVIEYSEVQASISAPILWIFFVSRPDRIWKNVLAGQKCSSQMLASHSWLLSTAAVGIFEAFYLHNTDMFYTRFMIIIGVVGMAVWGYSVQLHDDHLHLPIKEREERVISIVMTILALFGIVYLVCAQGGIVDWVNSDAVALITVFAIFILSLEFLVWLITNLFLGDKEWHRIPMYYGGMDEFTDSDDYFPEGGQSPPSNQGGSTEGGRPRPPFETPPLKSDES